MPQFTIQSVEPAGTWTPEGGTTLNKFSVGVTDPGTGQLVTAQMFYPQDANPPEVGAVLNDRILKRSNKGYTLSKDKSAQTTPQAAQQEQNIAEQTFGVSPSQTLPAQSAPVQNTPTDWDAKDRRITRQHSQTAAISILGFLGFPEEPEKARAAIVAWCDWLDADAYGENR